MNFTDLARRRYSVRKYSDKPIEREKLNRILAAGMLAPTAKNQQPQKIYVVQSKENIDKLAQLTHCGYGSPTVLIFAYDLNEDWKNPLENGVRSGIEDVSIVATHIMLAAAEEGIATCWCNYFSNTHLEKAFNLPANIKTVLIMPIGYAAEEAKAAPTHLISKDMEDVIKFL